MPYRELIQTDAFIEAIRTSLTRGQAIQLLSALAALGKDEAALRNHDWVEIAPLGDSSTAVTRLTIHDDDDTCWSAFMLFDETVNVLVMLYAAPGDRVSAEDLQIIEQVSQHAEKAFRGVKPSVWRMR